jgi:hypothetical protein
MQRRVLAPFDPLTARVVPFELKWSLLNRIEFTTTFDFCSLILQLLDTRKRCRHTDIQATPRGNPMSEAKHLIEDARKSFRLASTAQGPDEMENYVKMGREYIQLARTAAKVGEKLAVPPTWRGS